VASTFPSARHQAVNEACSARLIIITQAIWLLCYLLGYDNSYTFTMPAVPRIGQNTFILIDLLYHLSLCLSLYIHFFWWASPIYHLPIRHPVLHFLGTPSRRPLALTCTPSPPLHTRNVTSHITSHISHLTNSHPFRLNRLPSASPSSFGS
jgi:hypothetical protein